MSEWLSAASSWSSWSSVVVDVVLVVVVVGATDAVLITHVMSSQSEPTLIWTVWVAETRVGRAVSTAS